MFSFWLFLIVTNIITLTILIPIIDKNLLPLSRLSRMTIIHQIFTLHNTILSFINLRPKEMSSSSKALDKLVALYHPPLYLSENSTEHDILMLRYHSKQMLTGLHPPRPPSCLISHHIFEYDGNEVNMYSIQNDQIDDWKNSTRPFVLYFHGGGFVFGGIDTYAGFECHLSKDLNLLVLHIEFGLVPEHRLAWSMEDVIDVYKVLLHVDPNIHRRLIGMGDSSGGMLWIYLLQWLVLNNKPVPQAVVLHSPWTDLEFKNINYSVDTNVYLSLDLAFHLRQLAIGKGIGWTSLTEEEKGKMSRKTNLFHGFPPLYITVGTSEIFIDEIRIMTNEIKEAGGEVILDEGEGLMHSYALFHLWSSDARCAQKKIRRWIEEQLTLNSNSSSNVNVHFQDFC